MAAHPWLRRSLWGSLLALSALVILAEGVHLIAAIQAAASTTSDFCLDYQTAQHWLQDERIYTPVNCWSRYSSTPVPLEYYAHPPFSLLVVVPFALLSASAASWAWGLLSLACLVSSFLLACSELSLWRLRVVLPLLALFLLWDPTLGSIRSENIGGGVTCLFVVLIWRALRSGQQGRAGLLTGLILLLKPVPFLLLLVFVLRRQWRAAISTAGTLVGGFLLSVILMGPGTWLDYLGPARATEGFAVAVPSNLAVEGYVARWLVGYREFLHPGAVRAFPDLPPLIEGISLEAALLLGYALAGVVLLLFSVRLWKRLPSPTWAENDDASVAFILVLTFLVFPSAWDWSLGLLAMPLLWLGTQMWQRRASKRFWLTGTALLLLAIPFGWLVPAFQLQAQQAVPWPVRLAGAIITTLPSVGLALVLVVLWPWLKTPAQQKPRYPSSLGGSTGSTGAGALSVRASSET
jgi:hypothetical protein